VEAVRKTRSYRHWETLRPGESFLYNQTYVKGQKDHDWLLQKNIWRRMRYRRENKRIVQDLVLQPSAIEAAVAAAVQRSHQAAITAALLVDPDHPHNGGEYHPIMGDDGCDEHNGGNHHHHLLMCDSIAQAALDAQLAFQTFREEADQEEAMAAAAAVAAAQAVMDGHNDRGSSGTTDPDDDDNNTAQQQQQQPRQHEDDDDAAAAPDHHEDHDDDDMLIATAAAVAVAHDALLGDEVPV
jgi:hypothetical protein